MTASNTNALELLGKTVSFEHSISVPLSEESSYQHVYKVSGVITSVVISINSEPEISVDDGDFYSLNELKFL